MITDAQLYTVVDGIHVRATGVAHRSEEYDDHAFEILLRMQRDHFWYKGRRRFLHAALQRVLSGSMPQSRELSLIDLGGGCGGWMEYLAGRLDTRFFELALCDSSLRALQLARSCAAAGVTRYQADILDMGWECRWDVVFLLDVIEHIPDHASVLQQVWRCLKPGGLLFITVPALMAFWSYNDTLAHHQRRYSREDLLRLVQQSGMELMMARYFMFLLSPLLWISRLIGPDAATMTADQKFRYLAKTHRVPASPINALLAAIFALETPLGLSLSFPWGSSLLGVAQKPGGGLGGLRGAK